MLELEEHLSHLQVLWTSALLLLFLLGIMILFRGSMEVIVNLVLDNVPIMVVVVVVVVVEAMREASRNVLIVVMLITYIDTSFFTYQYLESSIPMTIIPYSIKKRLYVVSPIGDPQQAQAQLKAQELKQD